MNNVNNIDEHKSIGEVTVEICSPGCSEEKSFSENVEVEPESGAKLIRKGMNSPWDDDAGSNLEYFRKQKDRFEGVLLLPSVNLPDQIDPQRQTPIRNYSPFGSVAATLKKFTKKSMMGSSENIVSIPR